MGCGCGEVFGRIKGGGSGGGGSEYRRCQNGDLQTLNRLDKKRLNMKDYKKGKKVKKSIHIIKSKNCF